MTIEVTGLPQLTPLFDTLYMTGSFNNWAPGEEDYALAASLTGSWEVQINGSVGETIEFKFTRGNWETVEGNAAGGFLPDRSAVYVPNATLQVQIQGWEDIAGNHSVTPHMRILDSNFHIPQLNRDRRIWICLPDDYESSSADYPVWYMHDGQNLFDSATSFAGEWGADEVMAELPVDFCRSIIVGIDNGGADRINELAPWYNQSYDAGGEGAQYAQFIINTLKPFVDIHFRTLPQREHTATAGSSLGALICAYMLLEHSDVFGQAGLLSPAFWFNHDPLMALASNADLPSDSRVYLIAGQNESGTMVPHMNEMRDHLLGAGIPADQIALVSDPQGAHSEWFWAESFPEVYSFLASCSGPTSISENPDTRWLAYPNPAGDLLTIQGPEEFIGRAVIRDSSGKIILEKGIAASPSATLPIEIGSLASGGYFCEVIPSGGAVEYTRGRLLFSFIKK